MGKEELGRVVGKEIQVGGAIELSIRRWRDGTVRVPRLWLID
jgi:hypothetical protein